MKSVKRADPYRPSKKLRVAVSTDANAITFKHWFIDRLARRMYQIYPPLPNEILRRPQITIQLF